MLQAGLLREGESLYDPANIRLMHHLNAALRAHALYKRDVEYIVRGGEVIIVDEFTGRTMPGRRWSDGLHQAIEAKEGVRVREENQTVASITFQNYFRLYKKLSGMTGTADTEAPEFLRDLRPGGGGHPDPQADDPQGHAGLRVPDAEGQVQGHHRGHPRLRGARAAGAGGHHLDRDLRVWSRAAAEGGHRAPGAERQAARARGAHRRAGRPSGRGDHRHQHGGPRHGHRAGRQPRGGARGPAAGAERGADEAAREQVQAEWQAAPREGGGGGRPAHHRHRAPRVPPHRQPAARPLRPPGRPGLQPLLSVDGRQPDAHLRRSGAHPAPAARWPA